MLFEKDLINLNMQFNNRHDVLSFLADTLISKGYAKANYKEKILEREEVFPTGLIVNNIGVALPHTDKEYVNSDKVSLLTLEKPIVFKEMVGSSKVEVKVIFMLTLTSPTLHLDVLMKLIQFMQNKEQMDKLIHSTTTSEVIDLLASGNLV